MQNLSAVYTGNGFATGTLVETERGEVPVETLVPGDRLVTKFGSARTVRSIAGGPCEGGQAVKIPANGVGNGIPKRDVLVSPDQAICIKVVTDTLVPVEGLTYKSVFELVPAPDGPVWQIHLDADDVILAEGLAFQSGPGVDLERITDRHLIEMIRAILMDRAPALGWQRDDSPPLDLHLVVDGRRIDPVAADHIFRFLVPAAAVDVWIVSEASVPKSVDASHDSRLLGTCLSAIRIDDGLSVSDHIPLDHPLLAAGFQSPEGTHRWTDGCAMLQPEFWRRCQDSFFLTLTLARLALPRYRPSQPALERTG